MSNADQAIFEEVRLSALREKARLREVELDKRIAAGIGRWEKERGVSFHRYAAEFLTSDKEHPVSENTIYDVLARRNGRRPWDCLIDILFEDDEEFNAWKNERAGFEAPRRKLPAGGEALAQALIEQLHEFGPRGEDAIAKARERAAKAERAEWETTTPLRRVGETSK